MDCAKKLGPIDPDSESEFRSGLGSGSCLKSDTEVIPELYSLYNKKYGVIVGGSTSTAIETVNPNLNSNLNLNVEEMYNELLNKYRNVCKYKTNKFCKDTEEECRKTNIEVCILEDLDPGKIEKYFLPKIPKNKYSWLGVDDINSVLFQQEKFYPNFKFLGSVPLDFQDYFPYLNNLEYLDFISVPIASDNNRCYASVINFDKLGGSGIHWVSLFLNLNLNLNPNRNLYSSFSTICYFDSGGDFPPTEIYKYMLKVQLRVSMKTGFPVKILINNVEHQKLDTECGVYSIHFIVKMLENPDFYTFCKKIVTDFEVNKLRKKYFRRQ